MKPCPVCGSTRVQTTVIRPSLPIFQNVVFQSEAEAIKAPQARFELGTCVECGFSFNVAFDASKMIYDERYDNSVPSSAFKHYYKELIDMLLAEFSIDGGTVYDIGCGKGEFLEMLCAAAPNAFGIGIDPSCKPAERDNFKLINAYFEPSHFAADTKLVVVRHVLEHIEQPVEFMRMLRQSIPDVPVFLEVPDLDWILKKGAFWDFCYEHCNYFTLESLANAVGRAGFGVVRQRRTFGDQYQWAICRPSTGRIGMHLNGAKSLIEVVDYAEREVSQLLRLKELANCRGGVAIWGMATKGVVLSNLLPAGAVIGGVDVNTGKQGRFAAGSGASISPPEWLRSLPDGTLVLVMNPNYAGEIAEMVKVVGANVELMAV